MSDHLARVNALNALAVGVAEYKGSAQSRLVIELIDTTVETYLEELTEARAERVVALQASIKQLRALRRVFAGDGGNPTV